MKRYMLGALALLLSVNASAALLQTFKKGSTSRSVEITLLDNTTGLPATGVLFNASGMDLEYCREGAACVDITEATQTVGGAWSSGGFVDKGKGVYRLDVPDAALASGVNSVNIQGSVTGYTVVGGTIKLVDYDPESPTNLGLSGIPTASPGAANGVLIAGTNAPVTIAGTNASGATPATPALTLTGGAASTTSGGTSAPAVLYTGGAGAASTNGASAGQRIVAGGTTTVSGSNAVAYVATGTNMPAISVTPTGSGNVYSANVNTNALQLGGNSVSTSGTVTFPAGTLVATTNLPTNFGTFVIDANGRIQLQYGTGTGQLSCAAGVCSANTTQLAGQTVTAGAGVTFPSSVASPTNITAASGVTLSNAGIDAMLLRQGIPAPTTINTLASQTSFTLVAGSANDNAYRGYGVVVRNASTAAQQALGCVGSYTGSTKTVGLMWDPAIFTMAAGDNVVLLPAYCDSLYQQSLIDTALVNCQVDTAFFAGSASTLACILTDKTGAAVILSNGKLTGLEVMVLSGAQKYEHRFINTTTWDGTNSQLRITLSRAFPATLADAVTAIIR